MNDEKVTDLFMNDEKKSNGSIFRCEKSNGSSVEKMCFFINECIVTKIENIKCRETNHVQHHEI